MRQAGAWIGEAWARLGRFASRHQWQLLAITSAVAVLAFAADRLESDRPQNPAVEQTRKQADPVASKRLLQFSLNPDGNSANQKSVEFLDENVGDTIPIHLSIGINSSRSSEKGLLEYCEKEGFPSGIADALNGKSIIGKEIVIPLGSGDNLHDGLFDRENCRVRLIIKDQERNVSILEDGPTLDIVVKGDFLITYTGRVGSEGVYTLRRQP